MSIFCRRRDPPTPASPPAPPQIVVQLPAAAVAAAATPFEPEGWTYRPAWYDDDWRRGDREYWGSRGRDRSWTITGSTQIAPGTFVALASATALEQGATTRGVTTPYCKTHGWGLWNCSPRCAE